MDECFEKSCNNCGWYCHFDSKCYVPSFSRAGEVNKEYCCHDYVFDGLLNWEREDVDALVTMEEKEYA